VANRLGSTIVDATMFDALAEKIAAFHRHAVEAG
jgi:hypothetical protein